MDRRRGLVQHQGDGQIGGGGGAGLLEHRPFGGTRQGQHQAARGQQRGQGQGQAGVGRGGGLGPGQRPLGQQGLRQAGGAGSGDIVAPVGLVDFVVVITSVSKREAAPLVFRMDQAVMAAIRALPRRCQPAMKLSSLISMPLAKTLNLALPVHS